ncbi:hypothetical protein EPUS_03009 [Endocarpon pusillum Z07020]|uniref:Hemerythrin-like domain-containing protein n=1 Tax=Endocarpon pusillum (strain Z07020 / HMAS-L-300199) TaxID=1263415 RepID=U1GLS7_ENDPU|nr:uncharacterized protein EPUS_03009 [Endocarpon pusillum Z07020]ERF73168.1 hypothetical protein EPUS_03009 [Endocarpon pusillum Z07020]
MALVHNAIINGYNSIYQQAPSVKPTDYPDFIGYSLAWHAMVTGHHDSEEEILFPSLEAATGTQGLMNGDKAEHAAFHDGMANFKTYLTTCAAAPGSFRATNLHHVMDTFGPTLHQHLLHEPAKLASLAKYPIDIRALSEKTAKYSMDRTSSVNLLPMLWFNLDLEFEDGKWKDFPPVSAPVRWVMVNVLGWWRAGWWRFGSCGADGRRVRLLALREEYASG